MFKGSEAGHYVRIFYKRISNQLKSLLFIFLFGQINYVVLASSIKTDNNDSISASSDEEKKNEYKISVSAGNNIVQNGKKMAKDEYYLLPAFDYSNISGLYTGISCVYLPTNKKRPIDNFSLNAGYDRDFGENFSLGIDYTFSHYHSTKQIASSLPHTVILNASYYNKTITPTLSTIYGFGNASDITTSLDLSHIFSFHEIFCKNDKIIIPFIMGAYAGTSNSYKDYTKKNNIKDKKGKAVNANDINSKFGLTSAYISTSIKYRISFFSIGVSGIYTYQLNQSVKFSSSNLPVFKANMAFYF